jgi:hypothetical protein
MAAKSTTATEASEWSAYVDAAEEVVTTTGLTLEDIPEDIKRAVDKSFAGNVKLRFRFPDADKAKRFFNLCKEYARLAEPRMTLRSNLNEAIPEQVEFRAKPFEARVRKG